MYNESCTLCCDHDLSSYRRLADYSFEFSNLKCNAVIKVHTSNTITKIQKISDFIKIEGACHPVISECPFNMIKLGNMIKVDSLTIIFTGHVCC